MFFVTLVGKQVVFVVGTLVGSLVGLKVGRLVGSLVGPNVNSFVGPLVVITGGTFVGALVKTAEGGSVAESKPGIFVGSLSGSLGLGRSVGPLVSRLVGLEIISFVGTPVPLTLGPDVISGASDVGNTGDRTGLDG